jgi:hypothetical protein
MLWARKPARVSAVLKKKQKKRKREGKEKKSYFDRGPDALGTKNPPRVSPVCTYT